MVLDKYSVQNSPRGYFDSPMSSDSYALKSYTFKVTYITGTSKWCIVQMHTGCSPHFKVVYGKQHVDK